MQPRSIVGRADGLHTVVPLAITSDHAWNQQCITAVPHTRNKEK